MNGKLAGVRYGYVVNNYDPEGAGRVAVRLQPDDNPKKNGQIEIHQNFLNFCFEVHNLQ